MRSADPTITGERARADFVPTDEVDRLFGQANPNPSRTGCPSEAILAALARRERPMDDPGYVHLRECSPCYLEVRALQEESNRPTREKAARLLRKVATASILAAAIAAGLWYLLQSLR